MAEGTPTDGDIFERWNWHYVTYPTVFFGAGAFYQFLDQYVGDLPDHPWSYWLGSTLSTVVAFVALIYIVKSGKKRAKARSP